MDSDDVTGTIDLVNGILLAVTDTRVGVPGHFVGLDNFTKIWSDDIFHVAVWNTCLAHRSDWAR